MRVVFFQAEDGIRGGHVTGVQTCALPIWERERAAEAWVDVGDPLVAAVAKALHVRRPADPDRLGDEAPELDQVAVADRHALDRLAALRLDHRARDRTEAAALEVAEDVDRELDAGAQALDERGDARAPQVEVELLTVVRAVDVARPEPAARLHEHRERELAREG